MSRILLDHNATTNVSRYFLSNDEDSGEYVVETVQTDIDKITDYCHEARIANKGTGYGEGAVDYKIPAAIAGQLMSKGVLFDPAYMAKWKKAHPQYSLRDSSSKYFQVTA